MFTESDLRQFVTVLAALAENGAIHKDLAAKAIQAVSSEAGSSLLTRQEAARYLKCSVKTVDRLCDDGKLTKISIGRRNIRIRQDELKAMLSL